jgi:hypothetical protein
VGACPDGSCVVTGGFVGSVAFGEGEPNATTLVTATDGAVFVARYAGGVVVPTGSGVTETLPAVLPDGSYVPVTISFEQVDQGGVASVTTAETHPDPPAGFDVAGVYYEVTTTAQFSGTMDLCFTWVEGQVADEDHVRLLHFEDGEWVDVTTSWDTEANVVCGTVSSLSAFAVGVDTMPPALAAECSPTVLWPPNHKMVEVTVGFDAADNSGKPPAITVEVTSDEAEDGSGDGDTSPDWDNIAVDEASGVVTLDLRAERSGKGDGRVYTITVTATDAAGNASTATCEVTVPHSKKK